MHEKRTLGGGFGGAEAAARLCARLGVRAGSPVGMTGVGCPAGLAGSVPERGGVDATVPLED